MTDPASFNAGIEAARNLILRTANATRREVPDKAAAELVAGVLDQIDDGLALLVRAGDEARRRATALIHA